MSATFDKDANRALEDLVGKVVDIDVEWRKKYSRVLASRVSLNKPPSGRWRIHWA